MSLTYDSKKAFITHFGTKENWDNEYDGERLTKQMNRQNSRQFGNISLTRDSKGEFARAEYSRQRSKQEAYIRRMLTGSDMAPENPDNKAYVEFRREGNTIEIVDESERTIKIDATSSEQSSAGIRKGTGKDFVDAPQEAGSEIIEISEIGAVVRFYHDGRKDVLIESSNTSFAFDKPTGYKTRPIIFGELMNAVDINEDIARAAGIELTNTFMDAAKLVVAIDLGIEPDIKLFNKLDEKRAMQLLSFMIERQKNYDFDIGIGGDNDKFDLSIAEKQWHDTVDFEGYYIATAQRFSIAKESGLHSYRFKFNSEDKAFLIAQAQVVEAVTTDQLQTAEPLKLKTPLQTVLHTLTKAGQNVPGHPEHGGMWRAVVLGADNAGALAREIRHMAIEQLGAEFARNFVSSISLGRNQCMLAIRDDALKAANTVVNASQKVMDMIQSGSKDAKAFVNLMEQGADLKYVDPKSAKMGRSFADIIRSKKNTVLQDALTELQGQRTRYHESLLGPQ